MFYYERQTKLKDLLSDVVDWNIYYNIYSEERVPFENNILTIDVPGYDKSSLEITFQNSILKIYLKDDEKTLTYEIPKGLVIKNCKCVNGQIILVFEEDEKDKIIVEIE